MSKIRVLSDHLANQIAAGEVVERPASVAKELVENAIDAGARRVEVDVEAGGRRLLRVADDGCGMTRDDALLAFERHATSKISTAEDLSRIGTLGFRGEALASIASVARVELLTYCEGDEAATRVQIDGGRMRDVSAAARPKGTTLAVRDLFFNVPARRKFLRSEATESFHLTNLVTHYALAHPEIEFVLTNNGRESLRCAPAADLRERAYQIFGADFLAGLLEVSGGRAPLALVRGFVSAPRERRTTRDAQYLFVNGRYVRDRLVGRALTEGYRTVLPHGVFPAALLFIEVPLEEVDVNVHPAKTEVRSRRAAAVADAVREAVRAALAAAGHVRPAGLDERAADHFGRADDTESRADAGHLVGRHDPRRDSDADPARAEDTAARQEAIDFGFAPPSFHDKQPGFDDDQPSFDDNQSGFNDKRSSYDDKPPSFYDEQPRNDEQHARERDTRALDHGARAGFDDEQPRDHESRPGDDESRTRDQAPRPGGQELRPGDVESSVNESSSSLRELSSAGEASRPAGASKSGASPSALARTPNGCEAGVREFESRAPVDLPPVNSVAAAVRELAEGKVSTNIRPLFQLEESYIVAVDPEGLLMIDQHAAHERVLFDKFSALVAARAPESQQLLVPETFDLTPAQAAAFDAVAPDLEAYGFGLMRLSGRTVAVKAVPADLPPAEARNMLAEALEAVDAERRGAARTTLRERVAASLACRAAIKVNMPLAPEKMRWLIDALLNTSSPTTCPHGRPAVLRLTTRDIERGFHRP